MCCGPYDYHYPVFGGKFERANPEYGRVGSVFSDPYVTGGGAGADSNLEDPEPYYTGDDDDFDGDLRDPDLLDDDLDDIRRRIDRNEGFGPGNIDDLPDPDNITRPGDGNSSAQNWRGRPMQQRSSWR